MEFLERAIGSVGGFAWGPIMIVFLVGTGVYLTIRLGFIQFRRFKHSIDITRGKYDNPEDAGEISHFQALSAALSATIGTGNIAGVATAIALGGPGAIFWMWVTAIVGMATKYASCLLAVKYRVVHEDGRISGGPMYYLEKGLGQKWLGVSFAFFALIASFGIGNMVQANSVAMPLKDSFGIPTWTTGLVMAIMVGLVIIGGIKRIGRVASKIVPFMSVVYVIGAMAILFMNIDFIPEAFSLIFYYAFNPTAAIGGFAGALIMQTVRFGVARGVFSNESGLGSAPMAHAAAKTSEPVREGLVAMIGPFIDTIVICSMTALVIITSGLWSGGQTGSVLTSNAFEIGFPGAKYIVVFGLVFFAYSTAISWSYYGDRCAEYLFGPRAVSWYRSLFVILVFCGAVMKLEHVWSISDAMNGLMAIPNLIGVIGLSGIVAKETRDYFKRMRLEGKCCCTETLKEATAEVE